MWHSFEASIDLPYPVETVFGFFSNAENLPRITPSNVGFEILTPTPIEMAEGTVIDYRIRLSGIPMRWRSLITVWDPPHEFADVSLKAPYKSWVHHHHFKAIDANTTRMVDSVRYQLPLTPLGDIAYPLVKLQVAGIFKYRNQRIPEILSEEFGALTTAAT